MTELRREEPEPLKEGQSQGQTANQLRKILQGNGIFQLKGAYLRALELPSPSPGLSANTYSFARFECHNEVSVRFFPAILLYLPPLSSAILLNLLFHDNLSLTEQLHR